MVHKASMKGNHLSSEVEEISRGTRSPSLMLKWPQICQKNDTDIHYDLKNVPLAICYQKNEKKTMMCATGIAFPREQMPPLGRQEGQPLNFYCNACSGIMCGTGTIWGYFDVVPPSNAFFTADLAHQILSVRHEKKVHEIDPCVLQE